MSSARSPSIPVALNRRTTLKPLRHMNGDSLLSLVHHTRDNQAEMKRDTKSSEGVVLAEMNRQLRAQYRQHRTKMDAVRRQQESVYEMMIQLAALKRQVDAAERGTKAHESNASPTSESDSPRSEGGVRLRGSAEGVDRGAISNSNTGPLYPLLREAAGRGLNENESESAKNPVGSSEKSPTGLADGMSRGTPAEATTGKTRLNPSWNAARAFTGAAFFTAALFRPNALPPIEETDAAGPRPQSAAGGRPSSAVAASARGAAANNATGSSDLESGARRVSKARKRRKLTDADKKKLLDSEPCPIHRLTESGSFAHDPDMYVRRTFAAELEHFRDESRRIKLLEDCKLSRKRQAALVTDFFRNLFPAKESSESVSKFVESPPETPPPPERLKRRPQGAAASSLADCGYLRQYTRPSDRIRELSPVTSWRQRY